MMPSVPSVADLRDYACNPELPRLGDVAIGCIGSGFAMADCHLVAYCNAGFHVAGIASRSTDKARAVAQRHGIGRVHSDYRDLLADPKISVIDIAVPPDIQLSVIREAVKHSGHLRGILAQKPLGVDYAEAVEIVRLCEQAGICLAVNQNMRYDQSVRACERLLSGGVLGDPILATIDMRAIPHWMPWQEQLGWVTCRIMSIHHLDTFRFWFGDPERIYASFAKDPRTQRGFDHEDGICLYTLEYADGSRAASWDDVWAGPANEGAAADLGIRWRVEGTAGMAKGTIGWPDYPNRFPSTIDFTTTQSDQWISPRWDDVWFPDAFAGPMAELLCAIEQNREPTISGRSNLGTMALVEAAYRSAKEKRAVEITEIAGEQ